MVEYFLIVDTDEYSGNFEREMVAYMTGLVGECGVGHEAASLFKEDEGADTAAWMERNVLSMPDDHGCWRPARIAPTPGWYNDGMGNHYGHGAKELKGCHKWPAYQSVEMCLKEAPPDHRAALLVRRAKAFIAEQRKVSRFDRDNKPGMIIAVRLVERTTVTTDKEIKTWLAGRKHADQD